MIIVGLIDTKEEAKEITYISKLFVVGKRAAFLAQQGKKITDLIEEVD